MTPKLFLVQSKETPESDLIFPRKFAEQMARATQIQQEEAAKVREQKIKTTRGDAQNILCESES